MFPIIHYYANQVAYGEVSPLLALGGLFPDLAAGCGLDRDNAHQMGAPFFRFCQAHAPEALDLARGVISHGVEPRGVDYYADEYWPGCAKGWCFEQGRPWLARIEQCTGLPPNLLWWKSHNFIEICCELLIQETQPQIGAALVAASQNQALVEQAAQVLHRYTASPPAKIREMFQRAPEIFALEEVTAYEEAKRQEAAFRRRHHVYRADVAAIVVLLEEMKETVRPLLGPYLAEAMGLVTQMLRQYD